MKTTITLGLVFCLCLTIYSQEPLRQFGEISLKDFDVVYEEDPEAEAIVLMDVGTASYEDAKRGGFEMVFKRHRRILIKTRAGFDQADISIPYYASKRGVKEKIEDLKGATYYLVNGSLRKKEVKEAAIFTENINDQLRWKKFVFPNVVEGAIIEYQYIYRSPFSTNLPNWEFQSVIPTIHSQYTYNFIPFYEYVFLIQGISKISKYVTDEAKGLPRRFGGVEFREKKHTIVMNNIPAFKDESFITRKDDHIMKIIFQLAGVNRPDGFKQEIITTYPKLIKALIEHNYFGKYLDKAERVSKNLIDHLDLAGKGDLEKCELIVDYMKSNYEWDGTDQKYTARNPKEVIQQKKGNSVELNLLLVALLRKEGIVADPVIFSTRAHGKIYKEYPFDHQFNGVLVFIEAAEKQFLTDATDPLVPYNRIPVRCMNNQGLVVKKDAEIWVNMYSGINSKNTYRIELTPDPAAARVRVVVDNTMSEVEGYNARLKYENDLEEIKKDLAEKQLETITNLTTENFKAANKNYIIKYSAEMDLDSFDDKILIAPLLHFPLKENPLKHKTRTYPVDFIYKKTHSYGSKIHIPEGYKLGNLPENLMIDNDLVRIAYIAKQEGQKVNVTAMVRFKKAIYEPNTYTELKEYMDIIVERFNEQYVLERE